MATHRIGEMFLDVPEDTIVLVTTNSFVKKNGRLVMGKGAAREARDLFPDFDLQCGKVITSERKIHGEYGVRLVRKCREGRALGIFQVKTHWRDHAGLELIHMSTQQLMRIVQAPQWASHRWRLNYPGIGNGRLDPRDVEPIIKVLPDTVEIWRR